jgi:hypothetical protein
MNEFDRYFERVMESVDYGNRSKDEYDEIPPAEKAKSLKAERASLENRLEKAKKAVRNYEQAIGLIDKELKDLGGSDE